MTAASVVRLRSAAISVAPWQWPMAEARRAEIDAHFAGRLGSGAAMWNGRVLLSRAVAIAGDALTGHAFETDFASFLWWRDAGFPDPEIRNVFAMAAIRASDGGFLLGVMGGHTANAGRVYFPAGTPEPADIRDGAIDFEGSVARELVEETGLDIRAFDAAPGWTAVPDGPRVALMKVLASSEPGDALVSRVRGFIASQRQPELADATTILRRAEIGDAMPPFVRTFLAGELAD